MLRASFPLSAQSFDPSQQKRTAPSHRLSDSKSYYLFLLIFLRALRATEKKKGTRGELSARCEPKKYLVRRMVYVRCGVTRYK